MARFATHEGEEITITFSSDGCWDDDGIAGSPPYWTPTDVQVEELYILGHEQDFDKLSVEVQNELLGLCGYFSDSDWK